MIAEATRYWRECRAVVDPAVCGDFAECFALEADRFAIVVGDVAGRGVEAGAAAGALLAHVRRAILAREPLAAVLRSADSLFTRSLRCESVPLASLFIAVSDGRERVLEYASAGHEPALHFTSPKRHEHLGPTGPLLGLGQLSPPPFAHGRARFGPDSAFVVVTDGVTESRRREGSELRFFGSTGVARVFATLRASHDDPARAICDAAIEHSDGQTLDDLTAIVVRPSCPITASLVLPSLRSDRRRRHVHRETARVIF